MRREVAAKRRLEQKRCQGTYGWLLPGIGQMCHRKDAEAVVLSSLAVAEGSMATAFALDGAEIEHPGVEVPLIGLQNLWAYGLSDVGIDRDLAAGLPYAPQDTLGELALAPFNPCVLAQTDVWAGTLGLLAMIFGLSAVAFEDDLEPVRPRSVNLFGKNFEPEHGYPLAGAAFGATFLHVAIGEETLFRGFLQSRLARQNGEIGGWLGASTLFGLAHVPNALALDSEEDQQRYLLYGVPFIALSGAYLGMSYRWHDYSLAPPVAIHFWYDFLLSAAAFAIDPDDSLISANVRLPIDL